ncbi:hypothetical protein JHN63_38935 [Streptomyces sp. MBT65]|nr:hypothetical protein [Streptomyces sp. MBT65]
MAFVESDRRSTTVAPNAATAKILVAGAVVLADTRRLENCFPSVDFFEHRGIPFAVGVNCFNGVCEEDPEEIRTALDLAPDIPLVLCDARDRESVKTVLLALLEHVMRGLAFEASGDRQPV